MINVHKVDSTAIPAIKELAQITWQATYKDILPPGQIDYMLDLFYNDFSLKSQMAELNHEFVISTDNKEITGFISYSIKDDKIETFKLHKIYVDPCHQGKGIGKTLINFIINDIKPLGARQLELNVNRLNKAVDFYKKLGFEIIKEEDIDIGHGYFMNDYVMKLEL